jgi:hypothetical protein
MTSAKRLSPGKLMRAIRDNGLTFVEAARRARRHLPEDARLSHTSVWSYATGRATPKRLTYIEAIEKAVGVEPNGLCDDGDRRKAASTEEERSIDAIRPDDPRAFMLVVRDVGAGKAHLKIRLAVPWPVALEILEALKAEKAHSPDG